MFITTNRNKGYTLTLLVSVSFLMTWSSAKAGSAASFEAGFDTRVFWNEAASAQQNSNVEPSIYIQPEWRWKSEDRRNKVRASVFARWDEQDENRSYVDIQELHWAYTDDNWDLTLGVNKIFWGVTESRHLVDIINQTNSVEAPYGEDKLGQPMLSFNIQQAWGNTGIFIMPYFRERKFPGKSGRLRTPLVVNNNAQYESSKEQARIDFALRYDHYIGDIDIGVHLFNGTSREPRFIASADGISLTPLYDQITQGGIDLQWTRDAWLWKLEMIHRKSKLSDFSAAVAGFEYTYYQIAQSATDLSGLIEVLYDNRGGLQPPTFQENDVFVGTRLALNDTGDSSVLAGALIDWQSDEVLLTVEAETRLSNHLTADFRVRIFAGAKPSDLSYAFGRDDYVQLRLGWHY